MSGGASGAAAGGSSKRHAVKTRACRTTARQFELLLNYIERHPCMVNPRFPSSVSERERHWQRLVERLNGAEFSTPKGKDRWKKTWFDWKCNVRAKARSAAGKQALSPLEERLIAITGLLDCEESSSPSTPRKEGLPNGEVAYEIEDASPAFIAGVATRARSGSSGEPVSEALQSAYGESQDEYIVPTSEASASSATRLPVPISIAASNGSHALVLTDVRSLASPVVVKKELVIVDEEERSSEVDAASAGGALGERRRRSWEERSPSPHRRSGHKKRVSSVADGAESEELRCQHEEQLFVANKRKLEAEERRADAEADFYREEKKRSVALADLHREEQRKMAAVADFHAEERRKAAAKVEVLLEHKKFYIEQQKTEVLRRRLLQLEIRKLKRDMEQHGAR